MKTIERYRKALEEKRVAELTKARDRYRAALEEIVNAPPGCYDIWAAGVARRALAGEDAK